MMKKFIDPVPKPAKKVIIVESDLTPVTPALFRDGEELPPEVEALPFGERPMIWRDLPQFSSRHGRTIADIVYDLALLTSHAYAKKTPNRVVVPLDLEVLTKLYDMYPSSCAWKRPDIRGTFEFLYGKAIAEFDEKYESIARLAMGRRYARMLGRVDTAQYRWLAEEDGKITRRLENILAKIHAITDTGADPLEVFESIATRSWALRGVDIDADVPMPTVTSVVKPTGTRGRRMTEKAKKVVMPASYEGGAFG